MKKRTNKLSLIAVMIASVTACSDSYELESHEVNIKTAKESTYSIEQVVSIANQFAVEYETELGQTGNSRVNKKESRKATSESVQNLFIPSSRGVDSDIYVVNYEQNQGFALVSKRKSDTPVIAFIEDGNFNEAVAEDIKGFKDFTDYANLYISQWNQPEVIKWPKDSLLLPDPGTIQNARLNHLVELKWGQFGLYGSYCPNGISGCVPTAVAQILAFHQYPKSIKVTYDGSNRTMTLDWEKIVTHASTKKIQKIMYDENGNASGIQTITQPELCDDDTHHQIATLLRQLGYDFSSEYLPTHTETQTKPESLYFPLYNKYGMNDSFKFIPYSMQEVRGAILTAKRPVLMSGCIDDNPNDGHVWICDGAWEKTSSTGEKSTYFYYNWGYDGQFNGYYLAGVFQMEPNSPAYSNIKTMRINHK